MIIWNGSLKFHNHLLQIETKVSICTSKFPNHYIHLAANHFYDTTRSLDCACFSSRSFALKYLEALILLFTFLIKEKSKSQPGWRAWWKYSIDSIQLIEEEHLHFKYALHHIFHCSLLPKWFEFSIQYPFRGCSKIHVNLKFANFRHNANRILCYSRYCLFTHEFVIPSGFHYPEFLRSYASLEIRGSSNWSQNLRFWSIREWRK